MADTKLCRIDPPDCGCTDCVVGYSKPVNTCTDEELVALYSGNLDNATGFNFTVITEIKIGDRVFHRTVVKNE